MLKFNIPQNEAVYSPSPSPARAALKHVLNIENAFLFPAVKYCESVSPN